MHFSSPERLESDLLARFDYSQLSADIGGVIHNHYYDIKGLDGQHVHRVLMRHQSSVAKAAERAYRYGYKPR